MTLWLFAALACLQVATLVLVLLRRDSTDALRLPLADIAERITRTGGEWREALAERLARHFVESQERVERSNAANRAELQAGLTQNRTELRNGLTLTTQALEKKFLSLEVQVATKLDGIGKSVEAKLHQNLQEGFQHFTKVQEHLAKAETQLAALGVVGQGISDLNNLLKLPHLRGGFGEATLERLLADFLPAGSFEMQYQLTPGSTERVDAIVRVGKQVLPIDSKFPREQVLPLFESGDSAAQESARKVLAEWIQKQARYIALKYIKPEHGTMDMALLFLPSETLYFEVCRNGKLFEELARLKVYPVSPNTLMIGLRSVTMAQEYYEMSRGVEQTIEDVKKARKHFEHFEGRFEEIGRGLKKAQEAFDTAQTHLGRYEGSVYRLTGDALPESSAPALTPGNTLDI